MNPLCGSYYFSQHIAFILSKTKLLPDVALKVIFAADGLESNVERGTTDRLSSNNILEMNGFTDSWLT